MGTPRRKARRSVALAALGEIRRDRRHGAHALAAKALAALTSEIRELSRAPPSMRHSRVRALAGALGRTQPAMGLFREWALEWDGIRRSSPDRELPDRLGRWARDWQRQLARELPDLVRVVRREFPPGLGTVLTLSRSETLRRVLAGLPPARRPREVVVLESRPGGEGRAFARDLSAAGLVSRVVPDQEGRRLAGSVDLLLVGADAVYADGDLVHKVGTRPLGWRAHRAGVPVVVVAGRSKWVSRKHPPRALPALFDRTPAAAISEYWTDGGPRPGKGRTRAGRSRAVN